MAKSKNSYEKKARKKGFLAGINEGLPTKGNLKNSVMETGLSLLVGVLGGGFVGAAIGRPSLLLGIATTGAGHFTDSKLLQIFGVGMMASNGFQKGNAVSGLEGLDGVKERLQAYRETFSEKLYLDKLLKKKAAAAGTTEGFGELQYFTYPDNSMSGTLAALDDIEDQIAESARQFQGRLAGGDDDLEIGDLEGINY
ncbi:MAG: hypothetical protein GXC78_05555 [Chitinophagaceae bacterium]|nr:hypothetical protein [Chitinophagaceae bacterium]